MNFIRRIGILTLTLVAILSAIASAYQPVDISIRFNGGGSHNKVYVGRDNIMEIMIRNDIAIRGIVIPLQFSSLSGSFSWVTPYGSKPVMTPYVKEHDGVVAAFDLTNGLVVNLRLPDTVLVGAAGISQAKYLPHASATVIASMKLRIPAGQPASPSGFCVDNILFSPSGQWAVDVGDLQPLLVPTFNGYENTSSQIPDAPPICFDIVAQAFVRGDVDDNMTVDPSDIMYLIQYMFLNGPAPKYPESADANSDGRLNIADVMFLVRYIFSGGSEPAL